MRTASEVRSALESRGLRATRQRLAVYDRLAGLDCHPTVEEVYNAVRGEIPDISLATVYKSLDALVACDLVEKLAPGPDGAARYDAREEGHYHARCLKTGKVWDVSAPFDPELVRKLDPDLEERLRSEGFRVTGYRLELIGYAANDDA